MGQSTNGGGTPFASSNWGADKKEWALFAARLGLLPDLLPVVCNPNANISPRSKIKKAGKLPSRYLASGEIVGFPKWADYVSNKRDLSTWVSQSDYGICVQTRSIRAIDVDVVDATRAEEIGKIITRYLGPVPRRTRSNSSRFLIVFKLDGDFSKRFLGKHEDDSLVEFLATGQQFVAAGTHTSGVRYDWEGLDQGIPTISAEDFERTWAAISIHHTGKVPLPEKKQKKLDANNDLIGPVDYPPSSAERVAGHCAQIKFFKDSGADYEPHWRLCAGLVKHTIEGEALVHEWSSKYDGYDHDETQAKLDKWSTPPSTCSSFGNYGGLCEKCKFLGKVKSPIQLGHELRSSVVESGHDHEEVVEDTVDPEDTSKLAVGAQAGGVLKLPEPFCVVNNKLCYQKTVDGIVKPVDVCDMLFYPDSRTRSIDGTIILTIKARTRHNGTRWMWNTFTMEGGTVGAGGSELLRFLGGYEIVPLPGGREYMELYMKSYMDELRRTRDEIHSIRTFGWNGDSFVIGSEMLSPKREPRSVAIGGTLAPGYNSFTKNNPDNDAAGRWVELVKYAYDRPGHEQYQMVVAAGFGSMLVNMFELNMGGPINLYGGRGMGKTTVCNIAQSMWGDPSHMSVTAKYGTTHNAMYARMAALNSFPWLIDEITNMPATEVSDMYYQIANATPRDALTKDRKRAEPFPPWNCLGFTTSNSSQVDKISAILADGSAEMSRTIEIEWRQVETMQPMEMARTLDKIAGTYGAAGRVFAQFVVDNQGKIKEMLYRTREALDMETGLSKEYRFWSIQLACIMVGGLIANKVGLYPFSTKALKAELLSAVGANKTNMADRVSTPTDAFHDMLTDLSPATIITQHEGDGRTQEMKVEVRCVGAPAVRVIRDTGVAYITSAAIREWCSKKRIGVNAMKKDLETSGIMLNAAAKYVLGKGTTVNTGQSSCWMVDLNKALGVDCSKITSLKLVSSGAN